MAWAAYKENGILPYAGGFLDQPIWFLAHASALSLVVDTRRDQDKPNFDWNNLSAEAIRMITWLEKGDNE